MVEEKLEKNEVEDRYFEVAIMEPCISIDALSGNFYFQRMKLNHYHDK